MKVKLIPKWYLFTILSLLCFGFISNFIVFSTNSRAVLITFNIINFSITIAWIILNAFLVWKFSNGYEKKAILLPSYFLLINVANLANVIFLWYTNYAMLFRISLVLKTIELIVVISLLLRSKRINSRTR